MIYFAHQISMYGTHVEDDILEVIKREFPGEQIINPSEEYYASKCQDIKNAGGNPMDELFIPTAKKCDIGVFTAFVNGMVGAGVSAEMATIHENGGRIYMYDPVINDLWEMPPKAIGTMLNKATASVQLTREYLEADDRLQPYVNLGQYRSMVKKSLKHPNRKTYGPEKKPQ